MSDPSTRFTRAPTHILDQQQRPRDRRRSGLSGSLPQIPQQRLTRPRSDQQQDQANSVIRRRRWLLAIFGRLMARFYERHMRRLSAGRWECTLCHRRIVGWAWLAIAPATAIVHEPCMSRSIWDTVRYYEYLVQAGLAPTDPLGPPLDPFGY